MDKVTEGNLDDTYEALGNVANTKIEQSLIDDKLDKLANVISSDSQIKAGTQEKVTDKLLQKGGAKDGVNAAAKEIADAVYNTPICQDNFL